MGGVDAYSINDSKGFNGLNPSFLAHYLIKAKLGLTYVVMPYLGFFVSSINLSNGVING